MSRQTLLRTVAASAMILLLAVLLYWQHVRFEIVSACRDQGGVWDGAEGRCKLVPPIYLERGIKRSGVVVPGAFQNRSMR